MIFESTKSEKKGFRIKLGHDERARPVTQTQ